MNMIYKWRYIFLIGIISAIILAALYFMKNSSPPIAVPDNQQKVGKNSEAQNNLKFQEKVSEIIKTENFDECEKVEDDFYRKVCVNNIALNLSQKKQDISYCQKIDNELVPQEDCERQVIFAKSIEKEDINVCMETKNQELQKLCQDSFYYQLAVKKEDINICDRAPEQKQNDFCHNVFLASKNMGQNFETFDCALFKGEDVKDDCKYLKDSLKKDAPDSAQITRRPNQEVCYGLKTNIFYPFCF